MQGAEPPPGVWGAAPGLSRCNPPHGRAGGQPPRGRGGAPGMGRAAHPGQGWAAEGAGGYAAAFAEDRHSLMNSSSTRGVDASATVSSDSCIW
ncbi:hypothetical protein GCM10010326_16190 [Streptomyces xanthochromogenes]|uniref:Uncharacterized protein n=1 Tax=Streptomyces xanthochromogenes TaxID=67384 RepID=A0ABQ2ZRQ6_9ACTN|nr:hypothetical protein GCM10010326_16190 [Streptomyces xanthochromogenes]